MGLEQVRDGVGGAETKAGSERGRREENAIGFLALQVAKKSLAPLVAMSGDGPMNLELVENCAHGFGKHGRPLTFRFHDDDALGGVGFPAVQQGTDRSFPPDLVAARDRRRRPVGNSDETNSHVGEMKRGRPRVRAGLKPDDGIDFVGFEAPGEKIAGGFGRLEKRRGRGEPAKAKLSADPDRSDNPGE
jgi:hypothetical protein